MSICVYHKVGGTSLMVRMTKLYGPKKGLDVLEPVKGSGFESLGIEPPVQPG